MYLAIGLVYLLIASRGAPLLRNPDGHWRELMLENAIFLVVTSFVVFFLSRRGFHELLLARQDAARSKVELVHRLAVVAEWKDDTIGGHNYRIARSAQIIAIRMGVPEQRARLIFHGAVLHDIGKVGMPDYLLRKDGIFTPEERRLMERHVLLGAALLEGSDDDLLSVARTIALTHHENWDGSGYPHGLARTEIPVEGRIVAVCDVLDALLSERSYKDAWNASAAVQFIIEQSGRKFDPAVVDTMLHTLPDIVAIREEVPNDPWIAWQHQKNRLMRDEATRVRL
ncbi:putative two component response regulator [Fimbriimonas ginsengisoli Gsoil 348]|uniref:Putative two component response regulator n=1 Tax=Fimbriimonas ginsengisoli Gsoil 348 TaxID=661478 RepID=A0A068NM07_FIMGI|nr:putative two component response regulator [Fimbriimonas ginsengisoli Gsoil 348]